MPTCWVCGPGCCAIRRGGRLADGGEPLALGVWAGTVWVERGVERPTDVETE